jgi:hypothetical protein
VVCLKIETIYDLKKALDDVDDDVLKNTFMQGSKEDGDIAITFNKKVKDEIIKKLQEHESFKAATGYLYLLFCIGWNADEYGNIEKKYFKEKVTFTYQDE